MKKISLMLTIALFLVFSASAQSEDAPYEVQGKYSLDVNFDPAAFFDAGAGNMFSMPYMKLRLYQPDGSAYRLGFNLELESEKEFYDVDGDTYTKESSTFFMVAPGLQKYLSSEGRIRPFYGAEVPISIYSYKEENEGGWNGAGDEYTGGYFAFGLSAVLGVDYYLLGGFYLSVEFTPGLFYLSEFDEKVDGDSVSKGGNQLYFGLGSSSGLKLGYRF